MTEIKQTHLYRGSLCVRSWSKYQRTVKQWSLCGIQDRDSKHGGALQATEDSRLVDCPQCVRLMHETEFCGQAKVPCGFCEFERKYAKRVQAIHR